MATVIAGPYCSLLLASQYRLRSAEVSGRSVYTHRRPGGAFRGAGGPQAAFAIECQMDELAAALGTLLLVLIIALYWIYDRLVGASNIKLG